MVEITKEQFVNAAGSFYRIMMEQEERIEELEDACRELVDIFPENSMSEMDAADFKDRAHRIWVAAGTAKVALVKVTPPNTGDGKNDSD